jgi:hypothetical protein
MKTIKTLLLVIAGILLFTLTSCDNTGCKDPFAVNYDVEATKDGDCIYPSMSLMFHNKVGTSDLNMGEVYSINGYDVKFSLSQYYVSGIRYMDDGGNSYAAEKDGAPVYLLVKSDQAMYDLGTMRAGHLHMLLFDIGVDSVTNGQDEIDFAAWPATHPLAAQSPAMHWSWLTGYIFLKVEGKIDFNKDGQFDDQDRDIVYHVGLNQFRSPVSLLVHSDIDEANEQVSISFDLAKVFTGIDLSDSTNLSTHTMNNMPLATKVSANYSTAFSIGQ